MMKAIGPECDMLRHSATYIFWQLPQKFWAIGFLYSLKCRERENPRRSICEQCDMARRLMSSETHRSES